MEVDYPIQVYFVALEDIEYILFSVESFQLYSFVNIFSCVWNWFKKYSFLTKLFFWNLFIVYSQ